MELIPNILNGNIERFTFEEVKMRIKLLME